MVLVAIPVGLIALFVAVAGLLVLWASRQLFMSLFEWIGESVPIVGGTILAAVNLYVTGTEALVRSWVDAGATPLAKLLYAVPDQATQIIDQVIAVLRALFLALGIVGGAAVDAATGAATSAFDALLTPIRGSIAFIEGTLIPNLQWFMEQVQAELWGAWHQHRGETYQADLALGASIETNRLLGEQELGWAIDGVRGEIGAAVRGVEETIDARVGSIGTSIEGQVRELLGPLQGEVDALEGVVEQAIPGIQSQVDAQAAAAAAAAVATATAIATVTEWIRTCGEPLCVSYGPQIPHMHAFNDLLLAGTLGALVAAAIAEPEATAARVEGMISGSISEIVGAFSSG